MSADHTVKMLRSCEPVRNIRKSRADSFQGISPWYDLNNLMVPGTHDVKLEPESKLESDFLLVKRFDRAILEMRHQPCKIPWWNPYKGEYALHVPDFEAKTTDGLIYFQIKTDEQAKTRKQELELIGDSVRENGHTFEVWKKSDIHKQPRFRNCSLLCEEAGPLQDSLALDRVERLIERAKRPLSIGVIRRATGLDARALRAVLRLYVVGAINLDLDKIIDDTSTVYPLQ